MFFGEPEYYWLHIMVMKTRVPFSLIRWMWESGTKILLSSSWNNCVLKRGHVWFLYYCLSCFSEEFIIYIPSFHFLKSEFLSVVQYLWYLESKLKTEFSLRPYSKSVWMCACVCAGLLGKFSFRKFHFRWIYELVGSLVCMDPLNSLSSLESRDWTSLKLHWIHLSTENWEDCQKFWMYFCWSF